MVCKVGKVGKVGRVGKEGKCCAHETFRCFELCSICSREGLGRSKPATNPQCKHINTLWGFLLYPSLTEPSSIE
jgi:hypothetical protein